MRRARPRGSKFFQFHAIFEKIWQNRMLAPPRELAPLLGETLDPPLHIEVVTKQSSSTFHQLHQATNIVSSYPTKMSDRPFSTYPRLIRTNGIQTLITHLCSICLIFILFQFQLHFAIFTFPAVLRYIDRWLCSFKNNTLDSTSLYRPPTKLRECNFFTGVCLSTSVLPECILVSILQLYSGTNNDILALFCNLIYL